MKMKTATQQDNCYFIQDHNEIAKIMEIVLEVGNRLSDPNKVRAIVENKGNQTIIDNISLPGFSSFSDYPAICMLFGELGYSFPAGEWDTRAHQYMLKLQDAMNTEPVGELGLFNGAAGMGMAGWALSRGGTRYSTFITRMNDFIVTSCEKKLPLLAQRLGGHVGMGDYDGISGIAGVGRYLLLFKDQPRMRQALEAILEYLVALTADIEVDGHQVPGWYIPVEQQFLAADKEKYPHGNFNLGVAHGIPGPLAVLSLALLHKIEIPGQKMAIRKIVNWLVQFQIQVRGRVGGYWPSHISWEEQITGRIIHSTYERDGWCYGTPGVARSIYLAGCALGEESLQEQAIQAFDAVFLQSEAEWWLPAPTFCHGLAGLLHLTQLMFRETGLPQFPIYRQQVLTSLLGKYQSESAFGFQELQGRDQGLQPLDRVGLIDGTAGCLLTLLGLVRPVKTNWDAMFLVN